MHLQRPRPQDVTTTDIQAPEARQEEGGGANANHNYIAGPAPPALPPIQLAGPRRPMRGTPRAFMVAPHVDARLPRTGVAAEVGAAPAINVELPRREFARRRGANAGGIAGPLALPPLRLAGQRYPRREMPDLLLTPLLPRTELEREVEQAREVPPAEPLAPEPAPAIDVETPRTELERRGVYPEQIAAIREVVVAPTSVSHANAKGRLRRRVSQFFSIRKR